MMTTGIRCRSRSFCLTLLLAAFTLPAHSADRAEKDPAQDAVAAGVLEKIQRDCRLPVAGGVYRLGAAQCRSVRAYPDYFLSGALAPELYPDPLAARLAVTEPHDGWQRRDWLRHIVGGAEPGAPLAFALGYLMQAGQDALAGAPADAIAGGEFRAAKMQSTKSGGRNPEMDASARHLLSGRYRVPTLFLKETLLFDADAVSQYRRSGELPHLVAMNDVRAAVGNMTLDMEMLEDIGKEMLAHYQAEDLDRASRQQLADALWPELREHEQLLQKYKRALAAADAARQQQVVLQADLERAQAAMAAADRELQSADSQMEAQRQMVMAQQKKLATLPRQQTEENCRMVRKWINKKEWTSNRVCLTKSVVSKEWAQASSSLAQERKRIGGMEKDQDALRANRAGILARAEALRLKLQLAESRELSLESQRQAADMAYRRSLQVLQSQQLPALASGERVPVPASDVDVLQSLLDERAAMMTALRQALDDLHALSFIGHNWQSAIDHAGDSYLYAGSRLSGKTRTAESNTDRNAGGDGVASEEYRHWLSCDGRAFLDKPFDQGCDKPLPSAEAAKTVQHLEQVLRTPGLGEFSDLYQSVRATSVAAVQKSTTEADARLSAFVAPGGALARLGQARATSTTAAWDDMHSRHDLVQK